MPLQKSWPSFTGWSRKPPVARPPSAARRAGPTRLDPRPFLIGFVACCGLCCGPAYAADRLPSWQEGSVKQTLVDFLQRTTDPAAGDFLPPSERVAVLDLNGTLQPEQPMRVPLRFAIDRLRSLARQHPEWYQRQPYKNVLELDDAKLAGLGDRELVQLLIAAHNGMSSGEFERAARDWLTTARHPRLQRPYAELAYEPMRELVALLQERGYKVFVVTGDSAEFARALLPALYGVPPEQVIGTHVRTEFRPGGVKGDARPALARVPQVDFMDERTGKPAAVYQALGRRPRVVVGSGAGDLPLMLWSAAGDGPRLMLVLRHDDAAREYEYGKDDRATGALLNEARQRGWPVASMKQDWRRVFDADPGPGAASAGR